MKIIDVINQIFDAENVENASAILEEMVRPSKPLKHRQRHTETNTKTHPGGSESTGDSLIARKIMGVALKAFSISSVSQLIV